MVGGLETIDPNVGTTTQALGHGAAEQLLHGHLPWWNYNEQVGAPLAGEMQSAALFPFTPLMIFANGVLYFHIVLEMIAGIATYYLLRRLRCGEVVATVGGMLFALNGTFAWLTNAVFNPIAFLPLLLLGIEVAFDHAKDRQPRGWFLIALALALSCYAGFPEVTYLNCLLAVGWAITRAIQLKQGEWKQFLLKAATGFGVGILLAAPILIAFLDYYKYANVGLHAGAASKLALGPAGLPALIFPYLYGPIFAAMKFDPSGTITGWWSNVGGYLTLPLLVMAIAGLLGKRHRYLKVFLGAWVALTVARIYGFPGLYHVFNLIPGMADVAVYRYLQSTLELATIILAAFGLEYVLERRMPKRQVLYLCGGGALVAIIAVLLSLLSRHYVAQAPHYWVPFVGSMAWGIVVAALLVWLGFKGKVNTLVSSTLLVADALLMFVIPQFSALTSATVDMGPVKFLQTHLGESRFYSLGPIQPNYGTYYGIASIDTNNLPIAAHWSNYITSSLDPQVDPVVFNGAHAPGKTMSAQDEFWANLDNYRYTGVKYIVSSPGQIPAVVAAVHGASRVYSDGVADIYQLPSPLPYFSVLQGDCVVHSTGKSTANVSCKGPATLLRRELYMPGWKASTDGKAVAVKQTGPLFESVAVPSGTHTVRFSFLPLFMGVGVVLLLVGLGLSLAAYFGDDVVRLLKEKRLPLW